MKRIYNFILLLCLVQLAVAQNRIAEIIPIECWSFLIVPTGEMLPKIHCKEYRIALIWEWIW